MVVINEGPQYVYDGETINQSAKGTEMTDSMKTWQKSEFL